jgi:hypothetical protein
MKTKTIEAPLTDIEWGSDKRYKEPGDEIDYEAFYAACMWIDGKLTKLIFRGNEAKKFGIEGRKRGIIPELDSNEFRMPGLKSCPVKGIILKFQTDSEPLFDPSCIRLKISYEKYISGTQTNWGLK